MDQQGRPNELQLVYRRDPETGQPVEGHLRWGLILHFCEKRPEFAPIHARAETIAENEWFSDAYRRRRCVVPMNSFFQKDGGGRRHAVSRRDGELFGVAASGRIGTTRRTGNGSARSRSSPYQPMTLWRRSMTACRPSSTRKTFRAGLAMRRIRKIFFALSVGSARCNRGSQAFQIATADPTIRIFRQAAFVGAAVGHRHHKFLAVRAAALVHGILPDFRKNLRQEIQKGSAWLH
jgi:hypothetical protein